MKIYGITDTRRFYEKLNDCRGEVELVDEESGARQLLRAPVSQTLLPLSFMQGTISRIELIFHDDRDFNTIFRWLHEEKCFG